MIGARIRILRSDAGLKQKELAARLEIDQATLSLIENGHMPPPIAVLSKIVGMFGTTYDWLIEGRINRSQVREMSKRPGAKFTAILKGSIEAIMKAEKLDKVGFAKRIKSTPKRVEEVLNGDATPDGDELYNMLIGFPKYNANWILKNQGAPNILDGQHAIEELLREKDRIMGLMQTSLALRKKK